MAAAAGGRSYALSLMLVYERHRGMEGEWCGSGGRGHYRLYLSTGGRNLSERRAFNDLGLDGARDECTNERRGELRSRCGGGPVLNGPRLYRCDERGLVVVCYVECGVGDRASKLTVTRSLVV